MAKKVLLVAVMVALVAGGAFAQVSLGGGFSMDGGRLGGIKFDGKDDDGASYKSTQTMDAWNFGGHLFFDATYAELSFGFLGGPMPSKWTMDKESETYKASNMAMDISLLGKYPIDLGSMSLFPMLGVGYSVVLSAKDEDGKDLYPSESEYKAGDLSNFRILLGVGGDFNITDNLFFRSSLLGSLRLPSKYFNDQTKDEDGKKVDGISTTLGFGAALKLAIGYRF